MHPAAFARPADTRIRGQVMMEISAACGVVDGIGFRTEARIRRRDGAMRFAYCALRESLSADLYQLFSKIFAV
jgi:hypothetical protein